MIICTIYRLQVEILYIVLVILNSKSMSHHGVMMVIGSTHSQEPSKQ